MTEADLQTIRDGVSGICEALGSVKRAIARAPR